MDVLSGKRILIVEDEYLLASDIERELAKVGAQAVGPASRLAAGLALAKTEALDAAILDLNLNDELAYPIVRRLAERKVPYLLVTGHDDWALPRELRDAPRLTKPFGPDGLRSLVADPFALDPPS